jgi:hypothetical protein
VHLTRRAGEKNEGEIGSELLGRVNVDGNSHQFAPKKEIRLALSKKNCVARSF